MLSRRCYDAVAWPASGAKPTRGRASRATGSPPTRSLRNGSKSDALVPPSCARSGRGGGGGVRVRARGFGRAGEERRGRGVGDSEFQLAWGCLGPGEGWGSGAVCPCWIGSGAGHMAPSRSLSGGWVNRFSGNIYARVEAFAERRSTPSPSSPSSLAADRAPVSLVRHGLNARKSP